MSAWLEMVQTEEPVNEGPADRAAWVALRKLRQSNRSGEPQVSRRGSLAAQPAGWASLL